MLAPESEHVIALDGLAVIVNPGNPLKTVAFNLDSIAKIFSGEYTDWSQLGGSPGQIKIYARDEKSGTWSTFNDLVLGPSKRTLATGAQRFESSEDLTDAVNNDPAGIGFIGLPYIRDNVPLIVGSSCGISYGPSRFSIQSEVYPLSRRLFLYTPGKPANSTAREIIDFATSDAGQAVARDNGFIDQTIELEDADAKGAWIESTAASLGSAATRKVQESFVRTTETTDRSSVVFRFNSGSATLESKALDDVRRVALQLKKPEFAGRDWLLVGFADSVGSFNVNARLALGRAQAVGAALAAEGVTVGDQQYRTFSSLAPVACNDSDAGRALNRRVELWFRQ